MRVRCVCCEKAAADPFEGQTRGWARTGRIYFDCTHDLEDMINTREFYGLRAGSDQRKRWWVRLALINALVSVPSFGPSLTERSVLFPVCAGTARSHGRAAGWVGLAIRNPTVLRMCQLLRLREMDRLRFGVPVRLNGNCLCIFFR